MSDDRLAVIVTVLEFAKKVGYFSSEEIANHIVQALDQRTQVTKWEGKRAELLEEVELHWIPQDDLLDQLNALPGAPLTKGDLAARMKNISPRYGIHPFRQGDPELQAACLRVYYREKKAGTEFAAIIQLIDDEVLAPAWERHHNEREEKRAANLLRAIRSGRDLHFSAIIEREGTATGRYSRRNGQLYRLQNIGRNQQALFRVNDVGEIGEPTEPHIFRNATDASNAIRGFAVKLPPKNRGRKR